MESLKTEILNIILDIYAILLNAESSIFALVWVKTDIPTKQNSS